MIVMAVRNAVIGAVCDDSVFSLKLAPQRLQKLRLDVIGEPQFEQYMSYSLLLKTISIPYVSLPNQETERVGGRFQLSQQCVIKPVKDRSPKSDEKTYDCPKEFDSLQVLLGN